MRQEADEGRLEIQFLVQRSGKNSTLGTIDNRSTRPLTPPARGAGANSGLFFTSY